MTKRILLLAAVLLAAGACAAWAAPGGDIPCLQCHDDVAKAFLKGPHGTSIVPKYPQFADIPCKACHGSLDAHLKEPSKENIAMPTEATCRTCHESRYGGRSLATPGHQRDGVTCIDCHGIEDCPTHPKIAARPQDKTCAKCHAGVAAKFDLPFAHRLGEGKPFSCLSCHSPHGTGEIGRLAMTRNGGVCIACHTEKAGPFVYPHPPREVDGCVACHDPHGSPNPRQLVRYRVADLCLECHTSVPAFHNLSNPRYQPCQRCHVAVHGSNRNPNLFDE